MKLNGIFSCIILITISCLYARTEKQKEVSVAVLSSTHAKMPLLVGVIGDETQLQELAIILQRDLSFSGQCSVDVQQFEKVPTQLMIKSLADQKYMLAIFINETDDGNTISWRIYDTLQAKMIQGKKYTKQGSFICGWAHNCADKLWPILTGQEGCFSSKIAYCKETLTKEGLRVKHIYVADYDGSNEQLLVDLPTINIAPRWNNDINKPLLFYSEYTNTNVRLMVVGMDKKRKVASNFDGINMLPAFSQDGSAVVYCASRGDGSCQLYWYQKGTLQKLTHNNGNNVSPTFADKDQNVYFCSDFQTKQPQIYAVNIRTGSIKRITKGGYCTSPSYSNKQHQVAYTKMIKGIMQIFIYDCASKKYKQLTKDGRNKHECTWSPCGNYLLFSVEHDVHSRLARLNLLTHEFAYLTNIQANCSYPSWSPCYPYFQL